MKVEIYNAEFENNDLAMRNENYPNSGLFMVKAGEFTDLRFIDKSVKNNQCIAPESVCKGVLKEYKNDELLTIAELSQTESISNKYDGDFILEFSRILLNRK